MMILLDTSEFLWFISGNSALATKTKEEIQKPENEVFLSVVSLWEIIVKHALGRLPLPQSPEIYIPQQRDAHRIQSMDLAESSVKRLTALPALHRDPFDRMLICQAQDLGLHLRRVILSSASIRLRCYRH
jgi:PIN domain nuclease of toxin-antitoxin system